MKTPVADTSTTSNTNIVNMNDQECDVEMELGMHPGRRPTSIEKDVNSLGQKKRVSSILHSPDFKEELESVVTDLLRSDKGGGHVIARAIANVFSPSSYSGHQGIGCVSPINDLTGADTSLYSKGEKLLRCKLAALYRIVDLFGWTSTIFNHITVRVSQELEHFLINPFGLLYHEVSASKLLKVNMQGEVVDSGSTTLGFNVAGFTLHSAVHASRPDVHCVIHVHTSDVVAVSCMECGLLPISQEALIVGEVSYHSYHGILVDNKEKKAIQKHLGPNNKVMFLRNHGLVVCGETVEEAFHYLYFTMMACSTQVKAMSCMKHDKLIHLDRSALKSRTEDVAKQDVTGGKESSIKWDVGEMMFESLIRMMDDMGYRSGYAYRNPVIMQHKPRVKSNVELPATVVGHTAVLPEELEDIRGSLKSNERSQWVNSPNQYTRVIKANDDEHVSATSSQNGDASPRMRTKWKKSEESGTSKSTAVRITNANQFVPTNTDPRDVLATRKSIRGQGGWDHNRPGPQSVLLHSVSPDHGTTGTQVKSSSKAIIQKGHDVEIVSPSGPPNPFSVMTDDGIKQYEKNVLRDETDGENILHQEESIESIDVANAVEENKIKKSPKKENIQIKDVTEESGKSNENGSSNVIVCARIPSDADEGIKEVPPHSGEDGYVKKTDGSFESPGGKGSVKKKKKRPLSFLKKKK